MAAGRVVFAVEALAATAAARLGQTLAVELVVEAARARMAVTVAACATRAVRAFTASRIVGLAGLLVRPHRLLSLT